MSEGEEPEIDLDQDAGPSGKTGVDGKRVSLVVAWLILLMGALVLWPMIQRQRKAADRTTAISHLKGISLALLEFDSEFGSFPSEKTVEEVRRSTKTELDLSGTSSNAMFRQLIAFGIQSEEIFFCVHPERGR